MKRISIGRLQAIHKACDRLVYYFVCHTVDAGGRWDARDSDKVRVYLMRLLGWSYPRIQEQYGIPERTARRWQGSQDGLRILREAGLMGEIKRKDLVKILGGIS